MTSDDYWIGNRLMVVMYIKYIARTHYCFSVINIQRFQHHPNLHHMSINSLVGDSYNILLILLSTDKEHNQTTFYYQFDSHSFGTTLISFSLQISSLQRFIIIMYIPSYLQISMHEFGVKYLILFSFFSIFIYKYHKFNTHTHIYIYIYIYIYIRNK